MRPYDQVREAFRGTPLDGAAERTKAVLDLADDNPAWVIAAIVTLANAGLEAKLDATRLVIADIERTLPESMRAAGTDITRTLAADISKEAVEAIKVAVSGEIVESVLAAKTSLETLATQHKDTMTQKATAFGGAAEAAVSKLVNASVDVRNHASAISRLHTTHLVARALWAAAAFVFASAITLAGCRLYFHSSCVMRAQHFSTHSERVTALEVCP